MNRNTFMNLDRIELLKYIESKGSVSFFDLQIKFKFSNSKLNYHLEILEKNNYITIRTNGIGKHNKMITKKEDKD